MKNNVFIDADSEIPLIGTIMFGIIDRGTNLLQIRATTKCPLNCIFCSVDAGEFSKTRVTDYTIELNYLLDYVKEVVKFKGDGIEANIDSVGEPATYPWLVELIKGIKNIEGVERISMQSNGVLFDKKKIDALEKAGLTRLNLSINSIDEDLAKKLCGCESYDNKKIMELARYVSKTKIELLLAPVWIPGLNDEEIPKIIKFAKEIKAMLGIQNYLSYKLGRRPKGVKATTFWKFYKKLESLEKKFGVKLIINKKDLGIRKMEMIPLKFKKGEKAYVEIKCPGWVKDQMIGVAKSRCITVINCKADIGDKVRVKILDNKHNLYIAEHNI